MFWIIHFLIEWFVWFTLADKKRLREILPTCLFASLVGASTDVVALRTHIWLYIITDNPYAIPCLFQIWGMYIVLTYFFIQYLPSDKTWRNIIIYWFVWTLVAFLIEYIHYWSGHIIYSDRWNIGISYASYWLWYAMFYWFHTWFTRKENKS